MRGGTAIANPADQAAGEPRPLNEAEFQHIRRLATVTSASI